MAVWSLVFMDEKEMEQVSINLLDFTENGIEYKNARMNRVSVARDLLYLVHYTNYYSLCSLI